MKYESFENKFILNVRGFKMNKNIIKHSTDPVCKTKLGSENHNLFFNVY